MKKQTRGAQIEKPLRLSTQTLRTLRVSELGVGGGLRATITCGCPHGNTTSCPTDQ